MRRSSRLGVDPSACTVIEDSRNGMLAAKRAGMRCIGLVKETDQEYPATRLVTSLRDVTAVLLREH